jgi:hypothetical protein
MNGAIKKHGARRIYEQLTTLRSILLARPPKSMRKVVPDDCGRREPSGGVSHRLWLLRAHEGRLVALVTQIATEQLGDATG